MKTYIIKNVDCENCARKIETYVKKRFNAQSVEINLVAGKISIEIDEIDIEQLNLAINEIEPGVVVLEKGQHHDHDHDDVNDRKMLLELIISSIIFVFAIIFSNDLLFILSYVIIGYKVVFKAFKNMINKQFFDEFFLMSLATLAAITIGELPEATTVMLFYSVGEYIQTKAFSQTKQNISELEAMKVRSVSKLVDGNTVSVKPSELIPGDIIIIAPGEKLCVDAKLLDSEHYFNTLILTGESMPIIKHVNDEVLAGSIVETTAAKFEVINTEADSTISKLIDLITYASSKKTKSESFVTKFSRVYTPIVVFIALGLLVLLPLLGVPFDEALYRSITILVISCPCALVVSVPLGYVVAIGKLAQHQILVKGSIAIDKLKDIKLVATDKTGTLTNGDFKVVEFKNHSQYPDEYIHEVVYGGEFNQTHPIATSLVKYTKDFGKQEHIKSIVNEGFGISFTYDELNVEIKKAQNNEVTSSSYVYFNEILVAQYNLEDSIKAESYDLVSGLSKRGIDLMMLTGDNQVVAESVANKLQIHPENVYANLLPADKLNIVEEKLENNNVLFVGDGLNDAAVIKISTVGVSMGLTGSSLAIENSDVVISNDKIDSILTAITISDKTNRIIIQNITFAIVVKLIFIVLGIFGFTTMWEAVFSDVGVTILAIFNALRIRRINR